MTAKLVVDNPPELHAAADKRDADFHEGFEAGYRAYASQRAVLGSPAYRQGHAYGVQQAATERHLRAVLETRPTPAQRLRRGLVIGVIFGLILGWALVRSARADTLSDWQQLNEVCQGGAGAVSDKACARREPAANKLRASGWYQGGHGVWVSPEHVAAFYRVVRSYDATARANPGMIDKVMTGMMTDLRRAVPDEAIFALWNGSAGDLLAHTPYAAAMLMHGLPHLERTLSGRNDPRFVMVLKP